jgi:hypothetical protein
MCKVLPFSGLKIADKSKPCRILVLVLHKDLNQNTELTDMVENGPGAGVAMIRRLIAFEASGEEKTRLVGLNRTEPVALWRRKKITFVSTF